MDSLFVGDVLDSWIDFLRCDMDDNDDVPPSVTECDGKTAATMDAIRKHGFARAYDDSDDKAAARQEFARIVTDPALLEQLHFEILSAEAPSQHWCAQLLQIRVFDLASPPQNGNGWRGGDHREAWIEKSQIDESGLRLVVLGLDRYSHRGASWAIRPIASDNILTRDQWGDHSRMKHEECVAHDGNILRAWKTLLADPRFDKSCFAHQQVVDGRIDCSFAGIKDASKLVGSLLLIALDGPAE